MSGVPGDECRSWVDERGQATVEFALVFFAFLATALAMAALWRAGRDGSLQRHAEAASSHTLVAERALEGAKDLLLY